MDKPFFKSKKWWASVVGVSIPLVLRQFDIHLTPEETTAIIFPITAYILGQGMADLGKNKN